MVILSLLLFITIFEFQPDIDSLKNQLAEIYKKESPDCNDYIKFGEFIIRSDTSSLYLKVISDEGSLKKYTFLDKSVESIKELNTSEVICINRMLNNIALNVKYDAEMSSLIGRYIGRTAKYNFSDFIVVLSEYDHKQRQSILYKLDYAGSADIYDSILYDIDIYDNEEYTNIIDELKKVMKYILEY